MLGNKLQIFISFPYCVALNTYAHKKKKVKSAAFKAYLGDVIFSICPNSLHSHGNCSETNMWFLKKLPRFNLYFQIFIPASSQHIHTVFEMSRTYPNVLYLC
jgi:hypothetical protein